MNSPGEATAPRDISLSPHGNFGSGRWKAIYKLIYKLLFNKHGVLDIEWMLMKGMTASFEPRK